MPIPDQLDDADVQEFVNKKLNRPITFAYKAVNTPDGNIALITIPRQGRPFYLKKDFANLKANTVYVRRGSSTDIASLDEVARMGQSPEQSGASLDLSFASGDDRTLLGRDLSVRCHILKFDSDDIPLYGVMSSPFGVNLPFGNQDNRGFYREYAEYERKRAALKGVRFVIRNTGNALLKNLRLKAQFDLPAGLHVLDNDDYPDEPVRRSHFLMPDMRNFHSALVPRRNISVLNKNGRINIEGEMLDIQPKDTEVSADQIYFGGSKCGNFTFTVSVFADNLPSPSEFEFTVWVEAITADLDIDRLISIVDKDDR